MGESRALTLTRERARELSDRLEAARKESEAIRAYLEDYRRRARMFFPERRRDGGGTFDPPSGSNNDTA